jgi:hypothetical protein
MTRCTAVSAVLLFLAAVCVVPAGAQGAQIPVCGTKDSDGNTVLGSLSLNDNSSAIKTYGTGKGERHLALLYSVEGCTLRPETTIAADQVSILPPKTGDDLPGKPTVAVSVEKPDPTAVAANVALKLDDIDPGTHAGIVRIHAPQSLHDSFTPISESRTDWWGLPVFLGLLGSLAGLVWAVGLHIADTVNLRFSAIHWVVLVLLTLGAGVAAGYGYWNNQDVWTVGDNGWATLVSGFTASTTGALVGVTAALVSPTNHGDANTQPAGTQQTGTQKAVTS